MLIYTSFFIGPAYAAYPAARTNIDNALATASSPFSIDLDLDGDMDIVATSNAVAGSVVWYENNGAEAFTLRQINTVALNGALSAYPIDLDLDGDIDVVVAGNGANSVVWYENTGDPTLQANWTLRTINNVLNGAISTHPIDLDSDGDIDVVAAGNVANTVVWFENTGDPTVQANWTLRTIDNALNSAISTYPIDLDRDGDIDVVAASNVVAGSVVWYELIGDPTLQANWTLRTIDNALNGAISTYPVDLDRDGDIDVAAAGNGANTVLWYEIVGDPTVQANWTQRNIDANFNAPNYITASDLDGDGDFDILAAGTAGANEDVSWWQSDGTPANGGWTQNILDATIGTATAAIADDIDSDGDIDIVETAANQIAWFPEDTDRVSGDRGFRNRAAIDSDFEGARSALAEDIDFDGEIDVLAVARTGDAVSWWGNDGAESFTQFDISTGITNPWHASIADLDIDGDIDVVVSSRLGDTVTWFESDGTPINGGWTEHTISNTINGPYQSLTVDLDQDGDLDVLAAMYEGGRLIWWESDGTPLNGGWTEHVVYTIDSTLTSVSYKDLDKDGDIDLVVSLDARGYIKWFENDGTPVNGGWTEHDVATNVGGARSLQLADINNDGDIDVIAALKLLNEVTWWESDGSPANGGWTEHVVEAAFEDVETIYVEDIDRDGDLDVFGASDGISDVYWWENSDSGGLLWDGVALDLNFVGPNSSFILDMDKDGDLDLISAASVATSQEIAWWENVPSDEDETPDPNITGISSLATISTSLGDTGGDEGAGSGTGTEIEPETEKGIGLAEEKKKKSKEPDKPKKAFQPSLSKSADIPEERPTIVSRQSVKPIDYDNMLVLHYLSGNKLIVIANPAKAKTIALFFKGDIDRLKTGDSLSVKQEHGPEFVLRNLGMRKKGSQIEIDITMVKDGKPSDSYEYSCVSKLPERAIAKHIFNRAPTLKK